MAKFGIVVPLYNKAPYVKKALESIVSQTYTDWELVVVDDGSKDESYSIAKQYLDEIGKSNCRIIQQQNAGVSTARNNGVAMLDCKYVCFLDADDWWSPLFLERMKWLIDNYPNAGIYGVNYYYHKNGKDEVRVHADTGYINYFKTYSNNLQMPLSSSSVCVPKIVFNIIGGFPSLKLGEDFVVWVRIALKYKVAFLDEPLVYYNQDVSVTLRAVGNLIEPSKHMLWHLKDVDQASTTNIDLKILLDKLRVYGMKPYYRNVHFHEKAKEILKSVDWQAQPYTQKIYYKLPVPILNILFKIQKIGSICKTKIKSIYCKFK